MRRSRLLIAISLLFAFGGLGVPAAWAVSPGAFGTTSEVAHTVGAWEFEVHLGTTDSSGNGERSCIAAGGCNLLASLRLPSGAAVSRIELDACDTGAGNISFLMFRSDSPAFPTTVGSVNLTASADTGGPATPGCALFPTPLTVPTTIDNKNLNYFLFVQLSPAVSFQPNFTAIRVYYRLQVSPAPGTATFGDVPASHPFFQFIEALVASGITAGCGGGNYCPDAALTRGQMAVFLSKGLGLHFAP